MAEPKQRLRRSNVRWGTQLFAQMGFLIFPRSKRWGKRLTFLLLLPRGSAKKVRNFPFPENSQIMGVFSSVIILLGRFARTSRKPT
jgi:hypothetical protein